MTERDIPTHLTEDVAQMKSLLEGIETLPSHLRHIVLIAWFSAAKESAEDHWIVEIVLPKLLQERPQRTFPFIGVTPDDLLQANIPAEDAAQLSDADLDSITQAMIRHYRDDLFWDELVFHAQHLLERKKFDAT